MGLGNSVRRLMLGGTEVALVVALVGLMASPAAAAKPGKGGGSGGQSVPTGVDVSYPQCGSALPSGEAFAIVGVNDGLANDLNPCFGPSADYPAYSQSELYWAVASSTGATAQPKASLYVNTADPGNSYAGAPVADWPTSGSTPYGQCTTTTLSTTSGSYTVGSNSPACAWEYGLDKASQDASWLASAGADINGQAPPLTVSTLPGSYPWWLDVETANTWQSGSQGQAMNVADLQGMVYALQQSAVPTSAIGVYSTSSQWDDITGGTSQSSGSLYGLADWIPGARTLSQAESNCALGSFTGGRVALTQWSGHTGDSDYSC